MAARILRLAAAARQTSLKNLSRFSHARHFSSTSGAPSNEISAPTLIFSAVTIATAAALVRCPTDTLYSAQQGYKGWQGTKHSAPADKAAEKVSSAATEAAKKVVEEAPAAPATETATPAPETAQPAPGDAQSATGAEATTQVQEPQTFQVPYVLVGAGTASHFAMKGIQERDPTAKEVFRPYSRPPLSKEVWFKGTVGSDVDSIEFETWSGDKRNLFYADKDAYTTPQDLVAKEGAGVALLSGRKVLDVDPILKRLILDDGTTVYYEKCLLATGGRPRNLPVFQQAAPEVQSNVVLYRTAQDFVKLTSALKGAQRVAIVGGGFLGSELAVALAHYGKDSGLAVDQIFPENGNIAKVLPEYLSNWATNRVRHQGVTVHPSANVTAAEATKDNKVVLTLDNGDKVEADKVLVAVGIKPSTELARSARLEVDPTRGGIVVNSELQARSDIWVAGDVCNFYDISLGRRREEHHDQAAVSGRLAGNNMAGARRPYFHQSMFWSDLGPDVGFEAIGIVDSSLPTVSVWAKASSKDTPKAAMASNPSDIRAGTEGTETQAAVVPAFEAPATSEEYGKGVVFYMRENKVVGILLWNVFNSIPIARKIIRSEKAYENVKDLARFFNLHEEKKD